MKQFLRAPLSLLLALTLILALALPAAASEALGEDLTSQDTIVNRSTVLSTDVFWSTSYSDLRTENLITYTPNSAVTPVVTFGAHLTSCTTISAMARELESEGYRVVAGINGDFYNTSTGLPVGLVVTNGKVRSTDAGYYAIGFHDDGTAVLGKPALKISADLGYLGYDADGYGTQVVRAVTAVNKARVATGGIYLYTYDFNAKHTTGNTESGVDVICSVESGALSIGGSVTLRVEQVVQASAATPIGENQVVLSANAKSGSYYTAALAGETAGNTITVSVSAADERWNGVQSAVGALYSLVQDGAVVSGLPSGANPRTAVGQKADGTLIFYTIDGRQSGLSIGATMTQVAERLIEKGCVTALCLDGGGSTTLAVTKPDATAAKTVNSPSGGSERAVSNQIFLVASSQSTGVLDHFYVAPDNAYVLAGSKVNLAVSGVDTNYIPLPGSSYTLSASAGTVDGSVLTTPSEGGDIAVTASGAGATGAAVVHAVRTPDDIAVRKGGTAVTSLTMTPGSSLTLTATVAYNHLSLKADAAAFTWSLSGGIGSVSNGVLTAGSPGTGTLTVSAGGRSAAVQITVSAVPLQTLESFESGAPAAAGYSYGATLTSCSDAACVRFGRLSGKLDYTLGSDGTSTLVFDTPLAVGSAYTGVNLWVCGDGSGNALSLLTSDGTSTASTALGTLDFTGWRQLSAALPAGAASVAGVRITGTASAATDETTGEVTVSYPASAGTLYLDQLTATYNSIVDTAAPTVTASLNGTALTASITDAGDGFVARTGVAVTLDGKAAAFTYNASTGALSAAIPAADTAGHRVTVYARDASGNIGRASCDIAAAEAAGSAFTDTPGYWGAAYVDFMKTAGITSGYADGTFRPNEGITRAQFAVMLYRYLGLDGTRYDSVQLPFADSAKIGSYARTAVKALYSVGILTGTSSGGKLYLYPNSGLTRAQAAALIGRTQEKGYASAALSFTDAASIPAYAAAYIQTMTAQGVLGGYADGTFRPNTGITRGQMAKILYGLL